MLHTIKLFIASLRQKLFAARVEREIYHRIAPHIHHEQDHGYPFKSDKELWKAAYHGTLNAQFDIETIEKEADKMGKAYGDAFRYIMYRELNECLARYKQLMSQRVYPKTCAPRLVAPQT